MFSSLNLGVDRQKAADRRDHLVWGLSIGPGIAGQYVGEGEFEFVGPGGIYSSSHFLLTGCDPHSVEEKWNKK